MNKTLLIKALTKANTKGMNPQDTAELILDYFEIAGEIDTPTPPPLPQKLVTLHDDTQNFQPYSQAQLDQLFSPPPLISRVIGVNSDEAPWSIESLYNELMKAEWKFTVKLEGKSTEYVYTGALSKVGTGQKEHLNGVRVNFRCNDISTQEWPLFFPITDGEINPSKSMEELRLSVTQALSAFFKDQRGEIISRTKQTRTNYPGVGDFGNYGFGAEVV